MRILKETAGEVNTEARPAGTERFRRPVEIEEAGETRDTHTLVSKARG